MIRAITFFAPLVIGWYGESLNTHRSSHKIFEHFVTKSYDNYPMQGLDLWLIGASWHSEFGLFFNEEFYDLSQPWLLLLKDQAIIKKKM